MWLRWAQIDVATAEQAAERLEALEPEEVAFVHDVLADRAGPGCLVELIERRFGPYDHAPAAPEGAASVGGPHRTASRTGTGPIDEPTHRSRPVTHE